MNTDKYTPPELPPSSNSSGRPKSALTASSLLTALAHGSAPFLSTFLLIHLSAPMAANLGGSGSASSVMLFGREYYQTMFGERYLLFLPFAVHLTSAIAKRAILTFTTPPGSSPTLLPSDPETTSEFQQKRRPTTSPRIRKLTSLLSASAYTALFVFVPIHVTTHRLYPSGLISSGVLSQGELDFDPLESSELDFEFVKTALHTWPWRSWFLYTGLVGCVLMHAVEGASVISARWLKRGDGADRLWKWSGFRGKQKTRVLAGALVIPVLTGLWVLSREPTFALSSVIDRYRTMFMRSWVYRL